MCISRAHTAGWPRRTCTSMPDVRGVQASRAPQEAYVAAQACRLARAVVRPAASAVNAACSMHQSLFAKQGLQLCLCPAPGSPLGRPTTSASLCAGPENGERAHLVTLLLGSGCRQCSMTGSGLLCCCVASSPHSACRKS